MNFIMDLKNQFKTAFRTEESLFVLKVAIKVLIIPMLSILFISLIYGIFLRFDHIFFEAHGFFTSNNFKEVFYDFVLGEILYILPYIALYLIIVFFIGIYLGNLLLRPFKEISEYCESVLKDPKKDYNPNITKYAIEYKLLVSFCDYFFAYIQDAIINSKLLKKNIPKRYTKIHKPIFDKVFFLHYFCFIIFISIVTTTFLSIISSELHGQIVELAIRSLDLKVQTISDFLLKQLDFINALIGYSLIFLNIFCIFIAIDIYYSISTPSFAIFSTFRSFLKGNYKTRVHLIGFSYVRNMTRIINKFLNEIENKYT